MLPIQCEYCKVEIRGFPKEHVRGFTFYWEGKDWHCVWDTDSAHALQVRLLRKM